MLIEIDSKNIYNVTNGFLFQINSLLLNSLYQKIWKERKSHFKIEYSWIYNISQYFLFLLYFWSCKYRFGEHRRISFKNKTKILLTPNFKWLCTLIIFSSIHNFFQKVFLLLCIQWFQTAFCLSGAAGSPKLPQAGRRKALAAVDSVFNKFDRRRGGSAQKEEAGTSRLQWGWEGRP